MTKRKRPTKGQLNKIIDVVVHPYFEKYPFLILLDGFAHGLVERDVRKSLPKFVRYNAPLIVKELVKKRKP
jgi:hypothetical protein